MIRVAHVWCMIKWDRMGKSLGKVLSFRWPERYVGIFPVCSRLELVNGNFGTSRSSEGTEGSVRGVDY